MCLGVSVSAPVCVSEFSWVDVGLSVSLLVCICFSVCLNVCIVSHCVRLRAKVSDSPGGAWMPFTSHTGGEIDTGNTSIDYLVVVQPLLLLLPPTEYLKIFRTIG